MPLQAQEEPLGMIESAIEALADELGLEIKKLGATSLKRVDLKRFVEPDTCFYIQHEAAVRQKSAIDLAIDPPPDLAILPWRGETNESDYTNSSLPKFSLYAALGVPELWRYQQQTLEIYLLVEGSYQLSETSLAFPSLPVAEIPQLIEQSKAIGQRAAIRLFREQIRAILSSQNV